MIFSFYTMKTEGPFFFKLQIAKKLARKMAIRLFYSALAYVCVHTQTHTFEIVNLIDHNSLQVCCAFYV